MMTDCTVCKKRFRVDQMEDPNTCPACGAKAMTPPREFNLMMKTFVGPVFDEEHAAYLRAETCQPIFVDFNTIRVASRQKLPFGIAQTQPSHSVIMVKSRDGKCLPSPRLIEEVYHARLLWAKQGKSVTDVIIIGEDGFFSFSEEKTFNL